MSKKRETTISNILLKLDTNALTYQLLTTIYFIHFEIPTPFLCVTNEHEWDCGCILATIQADYSAERTFIRIPNTTVSSACPGQHLSDLVQF